MNEGIDRGEGRNMEGTVACFACDAVLFDMDGVLVDSMPQIEALLREWAVVHGLEPDFVVRLSHGRRDVDVVRLSAPHLDPDKEVTRIQEREVAEATSIRACPGASRLLSSVPASRWAVVTSGPREVAQARFRAAELPLPTVLVTSDDVAIGKPDPEGYLRAARRLARSPTRCLVVEDAPAGVAAARSAGMRVVGVGAELRNNPLSVPDAWVDDLDKLSVVLGAEALSVWAGLPSSEGAPDRTPASGAAEKLRGIPPAAGRGRE